MNNLKDKEVAQEVPVQEQSRICPLCKMVILNQNANFCKYCGTKLSKICIIGDSPSRTYKVGDKEEQK